MLSGCLVGYSITRAVQYALENRSCLKKIKFKALTKLLCTSLLFYSRLIWENYPESSENVGIAVFIPLLRNKLTD